MLHSVSDCLSSPKDISSSLYLEVLSGVCSMELEGRELEDGVLCRCGVNLSLLLITGVATGLLLQNASLLDRDANCPGVLQWTVLKGVRNRSRGVPIFLLCLIDERPKSVSLICPVLSINLETTGFSKQPIRTRYLGHVTGY